MRYTLEERFFARLITLTKYEARKRRNLDFEIDLEYLVSMWNRQKGLCALTNKPMSFQHGSKTSKTNPDVCTMDRIDPMIGYVKGNIQLTNWQINRIKNILSQQEFINICESVVNTLKEKTNDKID